MKIYRHIILFATSWLFAPTLTGSSSSTLQEVQSILDSAYVCRKDNPEKTIADINSLINTLSNTFQKAEALRCRGMAKKYSYKYNEAIIDYQAALEIEIKNNNAIGQLATFNLIGNIHKIKREYDKAVEFYLQGLKIGESLYPKPQQIANTHNSMGSVLSNLKRFEEAKEHFSEALDIRQTAFDALSNPKEDKKITEGLAGTYQDLGGMYLRMDSLEVALECYQKSIELNDAIDNKHAIGKIYDGIGSTYFQQGAYQKAIQYYQKSLEIKEQLSDKRGIATTCTNLCELYYKLNKYDDALSYGNKSIEYAKDLKYYAVLINTMSIFYQMAKAQGDNKEALARYESYIAYKDSLNSNKKDVQIQKIINQYKIEKEKAEAEKQAVIDKQKNQQRQNVLTTGLLSVLAGLFFYSRFEKKRRKQEEQLRKETEGRRIEEQKLYNQVIKTLEKDAEINAVNAEIDAKLQERTRVASALHDSVCSGLVSAKMHFESVKNNITPEDEAVFVRGFGLLNEAYEICREISHDLSPPMLAKFGLAPAIEDLCEKLSTPQTQLHFNATPFEERLDHQQELTLYQSIQELLQNILKHSSAAEAHVQLTDYGDSLNILVEDDGKGFDTAAIADGGIGLQRISTRVKHLGGSMDVDSSPGNGTTVIIDVPKLLISENGSIS